MLTAGSETKTQNELNSVFPSLKNQSHIHDIYKNFLGSINKKSPHYTIKCGTNIFMDSVIQSKQRFSAIVKQNYEAGVTHVDFKNGLDSANQINKWSSDITEGHIKDIVNSESVKNSILLILNAIYFDGLWRSPFDNNTFESKFFASERSNVKAEFMTQKDYFYYFYSRDLDAQIIRLPYKGKKFSMKIVMPKVMNGLNQLVSKIEGDSLKRLEYLMDEVKVNLTMPKFKFDYTSQMKPVLEKLGIREIFTNEASLPGIDRGSGVQNQLKVSNIVQKAGLVVHEKGSTAYAATSKYFGFANIRIYT